MHTDISSLLEPLVALARSAGDRILDIYDSDFEVSAKNDQSPLTAADLASHRTIVDGLQRLTPELPVLSEESAEIPFETRSTWREYWLVDPLDGTKEFVKRNGEFTVNIALIRDHQPVLGVVYVPVKDLCFYGCAGLGAFRVADGEQPQPLRVQPVTSGPVRVVGSRSHRGASLDGYLERLGEHQMVPMGSSLKLCLVATGEADVYPRLGPTSEWDTAAAQAVVEAAGGQVTTLDGERLRYNARESVLNPEFLVFGDPAQAWPKKVLAI